MDLDEGGPKGNKTLHPEVQQYTSDIQRRSGEIFSQGHLQSHEFFVVDDVSVGQNAGRLNFYDDSGRSLLAD
jgi:hypothetical protein